ncbi:hypothetical protein Ade02nite_30850 [Paractinoplanes deccanensis]|uniref:SGNH hydrolase-type esterase domain-containing protein n=1 Tax=Paractinoplanes deccanensis TaxID=113561 RepID=A0ABQ3Y376_9ACTN|nr:SGNH/GDSL hydrolase family protein [Actinoplanes deccanensis]GID74444.1 hypothetical protein Ade02nite_30850 [Actinoplanes deccanensis]
MRRAAAVLLLLCLGACAPSTPTVVTLGDSVPAGAACACRPFPQLYAAAQHARNVNLARSGATAADVLSQVDGERPVLTSATEVIIMIGANDMAGDFRQPARYATVAAGVRDDVASTVAAIERIHRVRVVLLGYWNVVLDGQVAEKQYGTAAVRDSVAATAAVNDALRAAAQRTGAVYVPTGAAFHGPDGTRDPTGLLAADGDHPNAAGQAAIAALIPPLPS